MLLMTGHKRTFCLNNHKSDCVIFGMDARISQVSNYRVYIRK